MEPSESDAADERDEAMNRGRRQSSTDHQQEATEEPRPVPAMKRDSSDCEVTGEPDSEGRRLTRGEPDPKLDDRPPADR
jgi:hypothetical protein